jgi:hypothetical protein
MIHSNPEKQVKTTKIITEIIKTRNKENNGIFPLALGIV